LYMEAKEVDRAADTAVNVACDLANTGSWMTLARLGQTLAREGPAAGRIVQPRHIPKHAATPWWRPWFPRLTHRSSASTPRAPPHLPLVPPTAGAAGPPPPLASPPAAAEARWLESLPSHAVMRTTVHKATPDITAHLFGELRVAFQDRPVEIWSSGRGRAVF